jgi:hypothetical protein
VSDYASRAFDFRLVYIGTPRDWAFWRAFRRVRRDVWTARESRLLAKWESYG